MKLRIKKDVDLKELEKYGFIKFENGCGTTGYSRAIEGKLYSYIIIIEYDKEFYDKTTERALDIRQFYQNEDLLYDLIKDGLVEKVDD